MFSPMFHWNQIFASLLYLFQSSVQGFEQGQAKTFLMLQLGQLSQQWQNHIESHPSLDGCNLSKQLRVLLNPIILQGFIYLESEPDSHTLKLRFTASMAPVTFSKRRLVTSKIECLPAMEILKSQFRSQILSCQKQWCDIRNHRSLNITE